MSTPAETNQAPAVGAGREPAAAAVRAWLTDVLRPRLCAVTGAPGTGKSHLTAWAALADAGPVRAVHAMISARGLTPHTLAWALAEQLSVAGGSPDRVVAGVAADRRPATVVLAELDESGPACDGSAAPAIVTELLDRLLESQHVRLLVEGRPEFLSAFTVPAEVVHLDDPELTDRAAFSAWLGGSPHAEALFPNVGMAALAYAAGASEDVPERWLARVPPGAVPALQVLASAYGPVGGAEWTALTAALTGDAEHARASVAAAAPLVTRVDDAFQLALRPLREAIRRTRTPELHGRIEHTIGRALFDHVPKDPSGAPQWARSHPYVASHLLRHAAVTGVAEHLAADAGALVHADPRAATAVLESLDGSALWPVWRAVGPGLLETSEPSERAALLRLSALLLNEAALADRFAPHADTAWEPGWLNVRGGGGWTGPVSAITHRDGAFLVAAADGTLHTLDAATGAPVGRVPGGTPEIWGLLWFEDGAVLHLDAHQAVRTSAVTRSQSRADRISGLLNSAAGDGPEQVGAGTVRDTLRAWPGLKSIAAAGHFIAGDRSGQVHVWDAAAPGAALVRQLHEGPVTAVTGVHGRSGRRSVLSGGADGTARLWTVGAEPVEEPLIRRNTGVTAATFAVLPSGPVAAMAWTDGQLRVWDLLTGDERVMNLGLTVNALALTPDGTLAVAGPHGTATLRLNRPTETAGPGPSPAHR